MAKQPMSDDDIRKQLKKAGGMLTELNTLVQDLTGQLEERAQPKAAASANVVQKQVEEIRPRNRYGFMLPRNLSGSFNSAKNLLEVRALPNYIEENVKPKDLAEFRSVLGALAAAPARQANREAMFPADLEQYLPPEAKDESVRRSMDTIEGKSAIGLNLAVLRARTANDRPVHLYVLEDKLQHTMIVAGPEQISSELRSELFKGGVSYVVKDGSDCVSGINNFVADAARFRGNQGLLIQGYSIPVVEGLIKAFSALCVIKNIEGPDYSVRPGHTLGQVVQNADDNPAVFTNITRAQRAAPKA